MWGRSTLTADSLVDDGIGITRFSRVLQPHCITNFIYLRQGIVQLFFGVGGREAEPDASLHQGRRRKAHSNHCDILRGQSSNDGTAKHSQKITQNFQSDFSLWPRNFGNFIQNFKSFHEILKIFVFRGFHFLKDFKK